jgi:GlpG protein
LGFGWLVFAAHLCRDCVVRNIGQVESEPAAQCFSDFLYVQRIPNQIEQSQGGHWDVWVHSDDDLARAAQWLTAFRTNPNDPQFQDAKRAGELREQEAQEKKEFQKRIRTRRDVFRRLVQYGLGPMTALLISICILVFLLSKFASDLEPVHALLFGEHFASQDLFKRLLGSSEIQSGQIWRLVTPMFLHFTFLHIVFNMMWLRDLGGMIETVEGSFRLLLIVLISALISNWAQFVVTGHPLFGGMSGVVYALLGYVWMKGKFQPGAGLFLHKQTVTMMLVWLVICFTGWLGPIANYAHLAGLIVGVVWGFLTSHR